MSEKPPPQLETWETEVLARHRWGQHGDDRAESERSRLETLWARIQPTDEATNKILDQIVVLEICNWDLTESIIALCGAIGSKRPTERRIGHMNSMSADRWTQVWAYYATLRKWLVADDKRSGYESLLSLCDPDRKIETHLLAMLGQRTKLKELYVERFCLFLEFALCNSFPRDSAQLKAHAAAASALEKEIEANNPDAALVKALSFAFYEDYACYPGLELCHHKLFRRLDIIISSIGAGAWRAAMPTRGTDGFDRADLLETYLAPIEGWIEAAEKAEGDSVAGRIVSALGERDDAKIFMASLLVSLLRVQQIAARKRAERWSEKPDK